MTRTHIAILKKQYANLILTGQKTVESRLTRSPCSPYNNISPGDPIYFKISSGSFVAYTTALSIHFFDNLSPAKVSTLQEQFNHAVCAPDDYWQDKQNASFATFIRLGPITPTDSGPAYNKSMRAWHTLTLPISPPMPVAPNRQLVGIAPDPTLPNEDAHQLDFTYTLTPGALKNKYIHIPAKHPILQLTQPPNNTLTLQLPSFQTISTSIDHPRRMIRWRGWAKHFDYHNLTPGDTVSFVTTAPRQYRIIFSKIASASNPTPDKNVT